MASSNLIKQLQERGLVAQVTDEEALAERLAQGPIALYCGFDPTADSLHLGHLVPLLCLKRFQQAGHKPVALVGGATGLIGDPSFKAAERKLNTEETVQEWVDKIRKQVAPFLDFDCGENSAIAANNYDWFGNMNVLTFLRDIGKHFSVNQMINKEAVKQRLNREDQGISFTEFSYNLLQGYDFACLNKQYGVVLQIGGSDQWGNITSGIDLTRRLHQNQVFGLTVPLITKADGTKFGKTEGGAVWLDRSGVRPVNLTIKMPSGHGRVKLFSHCCKICSATRISRNLHRKAPDANTLTMVGWSAICAIFRVLIPEMCRRHWQNSPP